MALIKKPYELSTWVEVLNSNGIKEEEKGVIIGAHDMNWQGAARHIVFVTRMNGTHELSFEIPDSYFDNIKGEFVHNEIIDNIFNETKIKLYYKDKWYEFTVKNVSESKNEKSFIKKFTCSDVHVDELARNGYGITFSTELYNNVDELGNFTREVLDGSAWKYTPEYNWGDFTEYTEERMFKVPVTMFRKLEGAKIDYSLKTNETIKNLYTHEERDMEMGDDKASSINGEGGYFWDDENGDKPLSEHQLDSIPNDGYIYIPYSQLQFCYQTTSNNEANLSATEEIRYFYTRSGKEYSYAIAPRTIDPTALIQFIAIPPGAKVEIDESGLLVNKDYTYIMTVEQWNKNADSNWYYRFLPENSPKQYEMWSGQLTEQLAAEGCKAIGYDGYLESINGIPVNKGKKISITDRTEINVTKEIDQYVTVYNNDYEQYQDMYTINPDWVYSKDKKNYRVCSKIDTRMITPQLARNLIQNGKGIKSTDGWVAKSIFQSPTTSLSTSIKLDYLPPESELNTGIDSDFDLTSTNKDLGELVVDMTPITNIKKYISSDNNYQKLIKDYSTIINFGVIGMEEELKEDQIYCFGLSIRLLQSTNLANKKKTIKDSIKQQFKYISNDKQTIVDDRLKGCCLLLGEGGMTSEGAYDILNPIEFKLDAMLNNPNKFVNIDNNEYITFYFLFKLDKTIKKPYVGLRFNYNRFNIYGIKSCELFKAFTKGRDYFENAKYRYSGRDLFEKTVFPINTSGTKCSIGYTKEELYNKILFEDDIMAGEAYEYRRYFIQQGIVDGDTENIKSTFGKRSLMGIDDSAIFDSEKYSEEQCSINTKYIDMTKCPHYNPEELASQPDCTYNNTAHVCLYQKYGYCPYLFTTEKHCRKIRTLTSEKSNRFNLTQEIGKVFEIYPNYYINHESNGKTTTKEENGNQIMDKRVFYIKESGGENKLGFRYGKNLSSISRDIKSDAIVTKLYVQDVDSSISKTGLCSIKTAEDNVSKDSFIINLDYYIKKGLLDKDQVNADLYGIGENDLGYLQKIGHLNDRYDKLSNAIINLSSNSHNQLEANIEVNLNAIDAASKSLYKLQAQKKQYQNYSINESNNAVINKTYINYCNKINELKGTLNSLFFDTFVTSTGTNFKCQYENDEGVSIISTVSLREAAIDKAKTFWNKYSSIDKIKESKYYKGFQYETGILGQFNKENQQIAEWKRQRASILKQINELSLALFKKYDLYLKEGTWSDSNYVTDNAYYHSALGVAMEGAIPKVEYDIKVIDLYPLDNYDEYCFNVADVTYVEDEELLGVDRATGLPNRLKVLISELSECIDNPKENSIKIQNFTTQFEDLFQQVTATVQSLTFNENIYKRASSFTANKAIKNESLQEALDTNELTLISTENKNVEIDKTGQSGSDINNSANKYKLTGEGLLFSNDGGETWNVSVGPSGINADYIKTGTLDAGKVRIVDNDYVYFLWDKGGIYAYREPSIEKTSTPNDFALFNKYGLSLVENNQIRLRAGYNYNNGENNSNKGDITKEEGQGDKIGFFLYNNKGIPIFSTYNYDENQNNNKEKEKNEETARIELSGEIFTSDKVRSDIGTPTIKHLYKYQHTKEKNSLLLKKETIYIIKNDLQSMLANATDPDDASVLYALIDEETRSGAPQYYSSCFIHSLILKGRCYGHFSDSSEIQNFNCYEVTASGGFAYYGNPLTIRFWSPCKFKIASNYLVLEGSDTYFPQEEIYLAAEKTKNTKLFYVTDGQMTQTIEYPAIFGQTLEYYKPIKDSNGEVTSISQISDDSGYYRIENNRYVSAYPKETREYPSKEEDGRKFPIDGATEMYINNKTMEASKDEKSQARLFCCTRRGAISMENDDTNGNIFTILKNGELYMGGEIVGVDNNKIPLDTPIPSMIKVINPGLKIDFDGNLHMDLSKFKDMNSDADILSIINSTVASASVGRHCHEINSLTVKATDETNKVYLPVSNSFKKWLEACGISESNTSSSIYKLLSCIAGKNNNIKTISAVIPDLSKETVLDTTGTSTEYAGEDFNGMPSTYVYTDPVE